MTAQSDIPSRGCAAFHIASALTPDDLAAVATLFRAYAASLTVDLAYQNFEQELAGLPGSYAPPLGVLLLARGGDGIPLGCVALRAMSDAGCCEMKRLFVSPAARGSGLGRALIAAISSEARTLGYREIRLDSLPEMTEAIALYRNMGFEAMPPYYETPIIGTVFLRRACA